MSQASLLSDAVSREVRRAFAENADVVARQLADYGGESYQREVERVQLAVLALADGDAEKIGWLVDAACQDYRDVLYWLLFDEDGNPPPLPPARSRGL